MQQITRRRLCTAALGLLPVTSATWAQQPPPVRLRGTIEVVDGDVVTVKAAGGTDAKVMLAEKAVIIAVVKATLAEIKEGTFLGSAAIPQADGTQKAVEVHIFPEEMRGTGEGHRPYPPVANGTMTNGSASGATVSGIEGSTITVKYTGGEKRSSFPRTRPSFAMRSAARLISSRARILPCLPRPRNQTGHSRQVASMSVATAPSRNS